MAERIAEGIKTAKKHKKYYAEQTAKLLPNPELIDSSSDSDEEDTAASLQNPEQVQFDEPDEEAKLLCEQLSEDLDQLKLDYEELERLSDERVQKHPVYLQLKQECDQAKAENDELKERIRQLEARV